MSRTRTSRATTAAITTVLVGVALAGPAVAAPGSGATTYRYSDCEDITDPDTGNLYTFCAAGKGVFKETLTPSGNRNLVVQDEYTFSLWLDGEQVSMDSGSGQAVYVVRKGETQIFFNKGDYVIETLDSTCTGIFKVLYLANGRVQFDDVEYTCSPEVLRLP